MTQIRIQLGEPDSADPLRDWVLEIDLGRLVSATKVVVRFAEEGDPFLQFRVHSAGGQNPFGTADRSGALDYTLVGGTTQPNRDQRVFEFDLAPLGTHTEEWTGRIMQYLRVAAHGHQWRAGATALCRGVSGVGSRESRRGGIRLENRRRRASSNGRAL